MTWHIFVLVWGAPFVRRFAELAVPFQAMAGNLPALAHDARVVYHVYSDADSRDDVARALGPLARWCETTVHRFDDSSARRLAGTDFKYELQRACLRDLATRVPEGEPVVVLDSNFVLADGTLAALAARRRAGFRAATVSAFRVATEAFAAGFASLPDVTAPLPARALLRVALDAMHPMTHAFYVDADPFTPYPSQLSWRVDNDGFVNRNMLPHPLMVPSSPALARAQSALDYDLVLRAVADNEIYACGDSDEMLVVKFSDAAHGAERAAGPPPSGETIGQFMLTCTNRRHRLFADTPIVFHAGACDARFADAARASQALIDAAYAWVDRFASSPVPLDARSLMYLKSHFGPIEEFMSPQLEPAALARLA